MSDLRERFDRDLADLQPPADLQTGVLARGRRLRSRHRAAQAASGLLVTGIATVMAVTVLGGSGDSASDPGYADDPPPAFTEVSRRPAGWWDMPARRMVSVLEDALPGGVFVTDYDLFLDSGAGLVKAHGSLIGVLTTDTGPGTFQVLLYPPDPTGALPAAVTTTAADGSTFTSVEATGQSLAERLRCRGYMTTCEPVRDDSGAVIGRVDTDTDQGTTYYEVVLARPDGGSLYFYVADSSGEKPGYEAPSATVPPLTTEELLALAQDPAWTSYEPPR